MHYIYKITCLINNKLYIGQAQDPRVRWNNHKLEARQEFPRMIINKAMKKHGIENFTFEVIVTCQTLDDANELETLLVTQYESHISTDKGYNVSLGGSNAPKTDAWKQQISKLAQERAPETSKQMTTIAAARPEDYYEYMKGNTINTGRTQSPEWIEMMRNRERSEEEKAKISESLRASYAAGERTSYFRDNDPWNKGKSMPSPSNKIQWTDEQIEAIKQDTRSILKIAADLNVSATPITSLRKELGIASKPGNTGNKHSEETRKKISEAIVGKLVGEKNGFFGKSHSEEAIEKNRQAHLGKCKYDAEQIAQMKELARQGVSMQTIALKYNCSAPTVKRMITKS